MTRQMPSAVVAPAHIGGGTDTFMRSLLELVQRRGDMSVDVVALAPDGPPLEPPPGVRIFYVRSRFLSAMLYAFREGRNPLANLLLLIATAGGLALRSFGLTRRARYDAIYGIGGPIAGAAAALVGNVRKIPAIAHFHWAYRFARSRAPVRALVRAFYQRFALVIGNSALLGRDAQALGVHRTRFACAYNWVDLEFYRPLADRDAFRARWQLEPARFVFLYVGRFDWSKQVDLLIAALRENRYDATFVFAGDGALANDLRALAPANDVRVLGTRPPAELRELHNAADVLLWGSVDVDYPGLVVMEAMASGLPVVTANSSMNPLYWGDPSDADVLGGDALTERYPASAAGVDAAIRASLARRDELRALRPAARAFAERRFGPQNADRLLDLLCSVRPA